MELMISCRAFGHITDLTVKIKRLYTIVKGRYIVNIFNYF